LWVGVGGGVVVFFLGGGECVRCGWCVWGWGGVGLWGCCGGGLEVGWFVGVSDGGWLVLCEGVVVCVVAVYLWCWGRVGVWGGWVGGLGLWRSLVLGGVGWVGWLWV